MSPPPAPPPLNGWSSYENERRAIDPSHRRRAALGRGRGRRPVPRRARRRPALGAARGLHRGRAGRMERLVRRFARTHGPFETASCATATASISRRCWSGWSRRATWSAASCARAARRASGATPRCCGGCAAPSLAALRKEIEPADQRAPPASWRRGRASTGTRPAAPASTACARCSSRSRASRSRPRCGSATCCRAASAPTRPPWLDQLCAAGEIVWVGAGALGRRSGRVALYFRDDARLLGPPPR